MTTAQDTRKAPPHDAAQFLALRRVKLDELFAHAEEGPMPDGEYRGTLICRWTARPCAASVERMA